VFILISLHFIYYRGNIATEFYAISALSQSMTFGIIILSFLLSSARAFVDVHCQEIHAVCVANLSFVTGDTCTSKDILDQERLLLNVSCFLIIV